MTNKFLTIPCTVFWTNPNKLDQYGKISGTFGQLSEQSVKELKEAGLKVEYDIDEATGEPREMKAFTRARSDAPVPCRDSNNNDLPSNLFLGNGTKGVAIIEAKDWSTKDGKKSGTKAIWRGLKVTELVKYDPDAAAQSKAEELLDGVSGGSFVFGGTEEPEGSTNTETVAEESTDTDEEFRRVFGEA